MESQRDDPAGSFQESDYGPGYLPALVICGGHTGMGKELLQLL